MKYYKDAQNNLFVDPIVSNHVGLAEIDKDEFDEIISRPKEKTIDELKDDIAYLRYEKEMDGVVYDGMTFNTDRDSQLKLTGLLVAFNAGIVNSVRWKCINGWYTITTENIGPIAAAVVGHVQNSFAWEEQEVLKLGE
jgi:hypothetical protein